MEKKIMSVLKYFSFFAYYPTLDEIYTFLPVKIDKNKLKYTPPQYSIKRIKNSKAKLNNWRFRTYIKLISLFPQIRLVGLSGSISMMNAKEDDDIDLFIITTKNRLFTGRLIALVLTQLLGLRRHRQTEKLNTVFFDRLTPKGPQAIVSKKISSLSFNNETIKQSNNNFHDKVCLNLFFDESNLKVPKFKQTEFVGHEVLQMKPIVAKGNVYERFLEENRWVYKLFPNAKSVFSMKYKVSSIKKILNTKYLILDTINDWVEFQLKKFQLRLINKHKTTEIITSTQLWFHPHDYNSFM